MGVQSPHTRGKLCSLSLSDKMTLQAENHTDIRVGEQQRVGSCAISIVITLVTRGATRVGMAAYESPQTA